MGYRICAVTVAFQQRHDDFQLHAEPRVDIVSIITDKHTKMFTVAFY